jgi:hypothetical protein
VIFVNTIAIGIQTSTYVVAKAGKSITIYHTCGELSIIADWYLTLLDQLFLAIYILELVLKVIAWRFKFFKSSWNIFGNLIIINLSPRLPPFPPNIDFTIVIASLVDFMIPLIVQNIGVFDARVLRVLRVFRAIRALRALRVIRTIRSPLLITN